MKITGTHLGILIILLFFTAQLCADDNVISLEQSGNNLQLGIDQMGYNNEIKMLDSNSFITSTSLDMYLVQYNDNATGLKNSIVFDVSLF